MLSQQTQEGGCKKIGVGNFVESESKSENSLSLAPKIMKGLIQRYERWNRVHPTYGAFWGMGVGIGCGIGWGPGFGPEVIGYVGAGCGIGFSVGITLAGLGVGLPANILFQAPHNAIMATRDSAVELARSSSLLSRKLVAGDGWTKIVPLISDLQRESSEKLSSFRQKHLSIKGIDFFDMNNSLPLLTTSACESLRTFLTQLFRSRRGILFPIFLLSPLQFLGTSHQRSARLNDRSNEG